MKHHKAIRKFGRTTDERRALLRSLAESLILKGRIKTTEAKAKELRPFVEKLVTKGRVGDLAAHRLLTARLGAPRVAKKLIADIAHRYKERAGGYTRIIKLPPRSGDGSKMAIIEFV